jgi:hypothetical protein
LACQLPEIRAHLQRNFMAQLDSKGMIDQGKG